MTIGDDHDLISTRFARDEVLQACYDKERRSFRKGDKGPEIAKIQRALMHLGYSIPDGPTQFFGDQTKAAVIAYQKDRGLEADGLVGPITIGKLDFDFT